MHTYLRFARNHTHTMDHTTNNNRTQYNPSLKGEDEEVEEGLTLIWSGWTRSQAYGLTQRRGARGEAHRRECCYSNQISVSSSARGAFFESRICVQHVGLNPGRRVTFVSLVSEAVCAMLCAVCVCECERVCGGGYMSWALRWSLCIHGQHRNSTQPIWLSQPALLRAPTPFLNFSFGLFFLSRTVPIS